jgi:hypothetical protein
MVSLSETGGSSAALDLKVNTGTSRLRIIKKHPMRLKATCIDFVFLDLSFCSFIRVLPFHLDQDGPQLFYSCTAEGKKERLVKFWLTIG